MGKRNLLQLVTILLLPVLFFSLVSCTTEQNSQSDITNKETITVFHAGSLSTPFKNIAKAFMEKHPNTEVKIVAAGSKTLAQKIITLADSGYPLPEIYASADYAIIDTLLKPRGLATFNILFAKNSIVIAYTDKSKYVDDINENNWYEILLREDVRMGRSDPEQDPCGYRTLLVMQLAEKFYNQKGLYNLLKNHPGTVVKPKEVDLIADLETGNIDYFWIYESVAKQHHFSYIKLPDEINLSSIKHADFYKTASLTLTDPDGNKFKVYGSPIVYGITIPEGASNRNMAEKFLHFTLTEGLKILEKDGQPSINPPLYKGNIDDLPENIKEILVKYQP